MADSYTDLLRLIDQVTGENVGTWSEKWDTNLELLEDAIAGMVSVSCTGGTVTLSANNGATDQARVAILKITGTLTSNGVIEIPAKSKKYVVWNATTGAFSLTVKTSGGAGYAVPQGSKVLLFCDGTDTFKLSGNEAFPVGSVFISVVSTDPATLLGYGTWSAIAAGRVLVGLDSGDVDFDTVEETGGAKTHTLTEGEIPSHTHTQNSHNHTQDAHSHNYNSPSSNTGGSLIPQRIATASGSQASGLGTTSVTATNQAATAVNQSTGGGGAHNNLQPYFVVYMWKRTA